ncbi:MAG: 50S ribosomal protein L30, partial [Myxococcota bacterium]|nr:50S ribosomal protein L30 [Myxococcota bacterium]
QRATVRGLGLRRIHQSSVLENTPAVRGMVKRVIHMVEVTEVEVD